MRKILVASLVATLTLVSLTPTLAAPKVAIGSKCSKVGQSSKIGTQVVLCTNFNKKLTWQPSVAAIQLAIWNDLQKLQSAQPDVSTSLEIHRSPNANKVVADTIIAGVNSAARLWQTIYLPEKPLPTLFFSEKDRDWFINEMKTIGVYSENQLKNFDNEISRNGNRANSAGVTGDGGRLWMTYAIGTSRTTPDVGDAQVSAHEYTHLAQNALVSQAREATTCWQIEGGAYFYGIYLGAKSPVQLQKFTKLRNSDPGFLDFPGVMQSSNANWEAYLDRFGANYDSSKCGPNGAYAIGSLAHEYLYSLKGHAGIISMLQKTADSRDFASAIMDVYGKPWPVIRKEIANYIQLVIAQN